MSQEKDNLTSLIDIVEIPRTYIEQATSMTPTSTKNDSLTQRFSKFERFLGALMYSKIHLGFGCCTMGKIAPPDHELKRSTLDKAVTS